MTTENTRPMKAFQPMMVVSYFCSVLAIFGYGLKSTGTATGLETLLAVGLITIHCIVVFVLNARFASGKTDFMQVVAFKLFKTMGLFAALVTLCVMKVVEDNKLLAISFMIGFAIVMIFETFQLKQSNKKANK